MMKTKMYRLTNRISTVCVGILFVFAAFALANEPQQPTDEEEQYTDQCITCHQEEDIMPEGFSPADVHIQEGLSCAGCHGGDPTSDDEDLAMSEQAGFRGVPERKDIPEFCGRCHSDINFMRTFQPGISTDQVEQYWESIHGKKLVKGDKKVADCNSCHTAHSILPASDPRSTVHALTVPLTCKKCHSDPAYMKEYNIPTDQFRKYAESVHGLALLDNKDTGAPACNDCHGNHGATPPGISSISHVCGTCHVNNMKFFATTKMSKAFQEKELHGCEECHGYHDVKVPTDDMVGTSPKAVCTDCHKEGDRGYLAADSIHQQLKELVAIYDSAEVKKEEVQKIGMDDVEIGFMLQEAHQSLIQARTLVHTFDPQKVKKKTDEGIEKSRSALETAIQEIHDYAVRRRGFGVATLFMTVLVIALYFKIKEMEKK